MNSRAHRAAALIHVSRRLEQKGLAPGEGTFTDHPFEASAPWSEFVALMNDIGSHEADIVPVACIGLAGIAQPGDQKGSLAHKESEISELRNQQAEKIGSCCRFPKSDGWITSSPDPCPRPREPCPRRRPEPCLGQRPEPCRQGQPRRPE